MKKQYLETGKIVGVHALKGEVRVDPWCDYPEFLCDFDVLYDKEHNEIEIERARVQKNIVIMKIKGVDTPEDAAKLRGKVLYMDRDDVELEEGTFFVQDLLGLEVKDAASGQVYGKLTDVRNTGANDIYTVSDGQKEYLIPAIPSVIEKTDIESGVMLINVIDGLFD
ncbi:MAG: 16S rRNA processing protein RimM [Oscillospiraceae bacterium]|nr:16S rRNA processing protein RimM [Oscillospiraceae bacterium]